MSLLDLPEDSYLGKLQELRQRLDSLKAPQVISARSGLVLYMSQGAGAWDATQLVGSNADPVVHDMVFQITFTSDEPNAVATLYGDVYNTVTDNAHKLDINAGFGSSEIVTAGTSQLSVNWALYGFDSPSFPDSNTIVWTRTISYFHQLTYYLKCRVLANCTGTLSVVRTS